MVTKAIIKEKIGNRYSVRIPIFESAGNTEEFVIQATLSYSPGNLESFKKDDVVFICFENNSLDKPVILGKLFTGNETESSGTLFNSNLKIVEKAELPINTTIGDVSYLDVYQSLKDSSFLNKKVEDLYKSKQNSLKYSKEESEIGLWLDSKKVYRKVFVFTDAINTTEQKIGEIGSQVDTVCNIHYTIRNSNQDYNQQWWCSDYINTNPSVIMIKVQCNTGEVFIKSSSEEWNSPVLNVVIEYTKKQD